MSTVLTTETKNIYTGEVETLYAVTAPKEEIYRLMALLIQAGLTVAQPSNYDGDGNCTLEFPLPSEPEPPAPHNSRKANEGYEPIATCDSSPSLPLDIQLFEILTIEYANRNSHFYSVMMPLKNIADTVTYYKPLRRLAGSLFDYLAQSGYRSKAQTDFAAMIAEMRGYEIANRMVFHKANAVLEAPDTDVTVLPKPSKGAVIGTCRVKRGELLMVREYEIVREWKPDHYLIKDPVTGGTFSRRADEIAIINIILKAVA